MWILEHCPAGSEWTKTFATEREALHELWLHLCEECLTGKYCVVGSDEIEEREPPQPDSAVDLLSTPCGCEFHLYYEDRLCA